MISILPIVNFPFINTNIPAVLAYKYISVVVPISMLLPTTAQKKFGYLKFLQRRKRNQAHAWNPIHNVISGNRESYFLVSVNVFQVLSLYFNFKLYFWRIIKYDYCAHYWCLHCKLFPLVTQTNIQHVLFRVAGKEEAVMIQLLIYMDWPWYKSTMDQSFSLGTDFIFLCKFEKETRQISYHCL
jgi:hypothetical protein